MKDEVDLNSWQNLAWKCWFYIQFFLELEWERFTPFFNPIYVAAFVHLFISTLEVYDSCVITNQIDFEEDLQICKKRDTSTNQCVKMENISDKDVAKLETYTRMVYLLYYVALLLPVGAPIVYCSYSR